MTDIPAAERGIVSACLADPKAVRFAAAHVSPDDFRDMRLGQLFGLIAGLVTSGVRVDGVTIHDEVARRRAEAGTNKGLWLSTGELSALVSGVAMPTMVGQYAEIVRAESVRRATVATAHRIVHDAESGTEPATVVARAVEGFKAIRDGHASTGIATKTLREVLNGPDDYDWVVPGLLETGDRVVITGGEGAGKSTWVRQLAVCTAAGIHPTLFTPIDPLPVLAIDAENSERQWRRKTRALVAKARSMGSADPSDMIRLACTPRLDITRDRDLGAVHQLLDEHKPAILVIGPLYKLVPRAITNDDDAAPLITALDSLRDRGVCLVMEAHAGHAVTRGGDRDLRPRGSAALMGWPEFGFGLALDRDQPQLAHLVRWRGDRDDRPWPDQLERGGDWPWSPARSEWQRRSA